MNNARLNNLITQAVSLDREIAEKTDLLKTLKAELIAEAKSREEEHTPTEGGGTSWVGEGSDGCIARIAFPAAKLKSTIEGEGAAIEKVRAASAGAFRELFIPAVTYRLVPDFRETATRLLGKAAGKLIKLCQSASSPRVSFETKEAA